MKQEIRLNGMRMWLHERQKNKYLKRFIKDYWGLYKIVKNIKIR